MAGTTSRLRHASVQRRSVGAHPVLVEGLSEPDTAATRHVGGARACRRHHDHTRRPGVLPDGIGDVLEQEAANVKALAPMQRVGDDGFGLDRRPIDPDSDGRTSEIQERWAQGREVDRWARERAMRYGHPAARLDAPAALRPDGHGRRVMRMCRSPAPVPERDLFPWRARSALPSDRADHQGTAPARRLPAALQRRRACAHRRDHGCAGGPVRRYALSGKAG